MKQSTKWWLISGIIVFLILLYYLSPMLTPFLIASLLAYLGNPLVNRMVTYKIPRPWAVTIVFIILFGIILLLLILLIPLLEHQIINFIDKVPDILNWIQNTVIPMLTRMTGLHESLNAESLKNLLMKNWQQAGDIAGTVLSTLTYSGFSIFGFAINLVLIPVVTFYLLRDWDGVIEGIHKLIPRNIEPTISQLASSCNEVIGAFFRGQLMVMLVLGIYYSLALEIMGLQLALLIGFIIGLVSVVPYLGFMIGIFVAGITAFVQYQDWLHLVYIAIIFSVGSVLESYILAPKLVGDRIGLHPVAVIFAVLAGGELFGFVGVLLALPVAAVIMVFIRYTRTRYLASELYEAHNIELEP